MEEYYYNPLEYNSMDNLSAGRDAPEWKGNFKNTLYTLAWMAFILPFLMLCSCSSVRTVTVERVRTDTIQITSHQRDSIYLRDSTHVSERQNGDTVFLQVERWHTKYREKLVYDTVYHSHVDSVPVPYPVPEYIEKKLSWWQQTRIHLGEALLAAILIAIAVWIIRKRTWWLRILGKMI